jgi:hypothetical protein
MQKNKVSHNAALASIIFCVISLFVLGIICECIGIGLGVYAVAKSKDKWGYSGLTFGIIGAVFSIIGLLLPTKMQW